MQHVLSVFRTQRVEKILFDLSTVTCKATITLHCENGGLPAVPLDCWWRADFEIPQHGQRAAGLVCKKPHAVPTTVTGPSTFSSMLGSNRPCAGLTNSYKLPTISRFIQCVQA